MGELVFLCIVLVLKASCSWIVARAIPTVPTVPLYSIRQFSGGENKVFLNITKGIFNREIRHLYARQDMIHLVLGKVSSQFSFYGLGIGNLDDNLYNNR
jgi:hypothetical protein